MAGLLVLTVSRSLLLRDVVKYVSVTVTGLGDLQLLTNISLVTKESGLEDKDEVK